MNFHHQSIETCFKELQSDRQGLNTAEAKKRHDNFGPNKLAEEKKLGKLIILLEQLKSPLVFILLIAGFISILLKEYIDAVVIFTAVFLNTLIGFFQENKANNALYALKKIIAYKAIVLRNGQEMEIDSSLVVAGDIIILKPGNRISADARLIEATELTVDEANLTGESMPSKKNIEKVGKGVALADRSNMVFASTIIIRGSGRALVTDIGRLTEIGQIAEMVKTTKEEKTPLQVRLAKLSKFIGFLVGAILLILLIVGSLAGKDFFELFTLSIAIAVSAIPEGLAAAVTVILVLGMQTILKRKALIRKLVAAETLGSTTVICSDKTGTLTEGKMSVAHIVIGEKEFEIKNLGSRQNKQEAKNVSLALQIGMMCNEAVIENPNDVLKKWRIIGTPTEAALLSAAVQSGLNKTSLSNIESKIATLPFFSETKFMATLHKKKSGDFVFYEKGAPEKLLAKSSKFFHHGKIVNLTKDNLKKLNLVYEKMTNQGLRVIGVAMKEYAKGSENLNEKLIDNINWAELDKDLIFVGFIAIKDPLRPESKETIEICRQAGIRPIIITGDHKLTAWAIAKEVGLEVGADNIVTGDALDKIDDRELKKIIKKINVYARVSPHHKLRIVKVLQETGEVVAMTGDGINDAPALKAADIGISLGTGTDIAKETSDIVLLDNNFKTIVSAVEQGRVIFSNIRKVVIYLISDSFCGMFLIIGSIILKLPLPIIAVQILWINIVNDGLPDFALAFEKGESGIMKKKPVKRNESIINTKMKLIIFIAGTIRNFMIFGLFYYLLFKQVELSYARTVVFAAIGLDSLIYVFGLRSLHRPIWRLNPFENMYLIGAVLISLTLLLGAIYWPPLMTFISTSSLSMKMWLPVIAIGLTNLIIIEIIKFIFAQRKDREAI